MSKKKSSRRPSSSRSKRKAPSIWTVIGVLLLLVLGYLAKEGYIDPDLIPFEIEDIVELEDGPAPPPMPQQSSGAMQVFFTTPYLVYPDEPAKRVPPPFEQQMLADIDAAQRSVDVAAFEYNLESVADALLRAKARGVVVRLALDRENLEDPEEAAWAGEMEEAGIPISWEDSTAFLHSKFAIIDEAIVWMGSWNFTNNGTYRNNNNLVRFTVPAIVENYAAEFLQMFQQGFFGNDKSSLNPNPVVDVDGITVESYFSPQDGVEEHILARLANAQERIRFLTFSYTSDPVGELMVERQAAGVVVQGVFENRNARGIGSEFERLQEAGVDVHVDGNCYTMHHKVIIIDDKTVITGSYNFTRRAEDTNDENLIIIDDADIARMYVQEFERVYDQARNPTRCGR
jgi:phosphatidylserine/phosphatidylglycerophosphate/cardiolipin synthase-like enzyme